MTSRTTLGERMENLSLASEEPEEFPAVVNLNVGGTHFTTCLSTLTKEKDSKLAAMFTGRNFTVKDSSGRYFIDCDSCRFEYILKYLRFEELPPETKALDVYHLAKYFGISSLQQALEHYKPVRIFKRMDEIANGPKSREYQMLKESAIKQLYDKHTDDDILIHIQKVPDLNAVNYWENVCKHCRGNSLVPYSTDMMSVSIYVNAQLSSELVWCLAEDLHTMGYGQYVYSNALAAGFCLYCAGRNAGSILLSSHKLDRSDSGLWKRV